MARFTRGDLAEAVEHLDLAAAMLILESLYEHGPSCVDWDDEQVTGVREPSARELADDERRTSGEERALR